MLVPDCDILFYLDVVFVPHAYETEAASLLRKLEHQSGVGGNDANLSFMKQHLVYKTEYNQ